MRIFIGSSSKQILLSPEDGLREDNIDKESKTYKIYEKLIEAGHTVKPWWAEKTFKTGQNILDELLYLTDTCNGAVFIFGADDVIDRKNQRRDLFPRLTSGNTKHDKLTITRDNVLIEFGLFMGKLGKEFTFAIFEDETVKVPFDIIGYLYARFHDAEKKVVDFFDKEPYRRFFKNDGSIALFVNESLNTDILEKKYKEWSSKSMFIGMESAKIWQKIETSPEYLIDYSREVLKVFFTQLHEQNIHLESYKIENVISLGPGCGYVDSELINQIIRKDYQFLPKYVPVDINAHLVYLACKNVEHHITGIKTPFAIVDDFETNAKQVGDIIFDNITKKEEVSLFIMLGGTFNNLKSNENSLFNSIKYWMDGNDYFLLDIFIKRPDYDPKHDEKRDVSELPISYKEFIINSIKKSFDVHDITCDKTPCSNSSTCSLCSKVKKEPIDKYSDADCSIPKTSIVKYEYDEKSEILIVKRYDFEEFKSKLKEEFEILFALNGFCYHPKDKADEKTSRGVFFFKKKNTSNSESIN